MSTDKELALAGKWAQKGDGMWSCLKNFWAYDGPRAILVQGPYTDPKDGKVYDGVTRTLDEAYALEALRHG